MLCYPSPIGNKNSSAVKVCPLFLPYFPLNLSNCLLHLIQSKTTGGMRMFFVYSTFRIFVRAVSFLTSPLLTHWVASLTIDHSSYLLCRCLIKLTSVCRTFCLSNLCWFINNFLSGMYVIIAFVRYYVGICMTIFKSKWLERSQKYFHL